MAQPVVHFEIGSKDYKMAQKFYEDVFDWKISEPEGMKYGIIEKTGENSIAGGITPLPENMPPFVTFYIGVDDLQAYLDKIEAAGGKAIMPPTPIPNIGSAAIFTDLDGNVIGLFKEAE